MRAIFKGIGRVTKVVFGLLLIFGNIILDGIGLILGAITKQ